MDYTENMNITKEHEVKFHKYGKKSFYMNNNTHSVLFFLDFRDRIGKNLVIQWK